MILVGPLGVGKTTLARAISTRDHRDCLWVAGTESCRHLPLGAFAHLLDIGPDPDPVTALADARAALGRRDGATLVVDDADLLDPLSEELIRTLAADARLRLLVTCSGGRTASVRALLGDGVLGSVELTAFDRDEAQQAVEAALGDPVDRVALHRMWEASEGNPLYLRHLVEGSWDAGLFHRCGGIWQLGGRPVVSAALESLLGARLRGCAADVYEVFLLSAFGGTLDVDLLGRLASPGAVAAAVSSGFLRVDGGRTARLSHPVLGVLLRAQTGVLAARAVRGRLVRALAGGGAEADPTRRAELSLDGDVEVDVATLVGAAERACALGDDALAERVSAAAFARGGGVRAGALLAQSTRWRGRAGAADALLTEFDPRRLSEPELVVWELSRVCGLYASDRVVEAYRALAALTARTTGTAARDLLVSVTVAFDFFANDLPRALELADTLVEAEHCFGPALTVVASAGGCALARAGRADRVPMLAARALGAARPAGATVVAGRIGVAEMSAVTLAGYLAGIDTVLERYTGPEVVGRPRSVTDAYIRGLAHRATGRLDRAEEEFRRAGAAAVSGEQRMWIGLCSVELAQVLGARGRAGDAAHALDRADAVHGRYLASFEPDLLLARAWVAAARGEHRRAIAAARRAAALARAGSMFGVEVVALHTSVRFGDRSAAGRLRGLARRVDGPFVRAAAAHAGALEARDGDGLDRAANEFAEMGALLGALDAAAQAALMHRRAGRTGKEMRSVATARRLAARCGGARTPALAAAESPASLTERERLVVSLVVDGLTNREIAERLTLSVRTVEGHVYRASGKLGAHDREGLVDKMSRCQASDVTPRSR
ncbi:LuxR C-terminal-related transcriptional regulator [Rhodococcus olei]|uniref:LuxR C-terminal-related transcriptional regulator n=2 Tax=Rhodococcus olei TaxID=2161675 RepID=A0ABP8P9J0_9NOCA